MISTHDCHECQVAAFIDEKETVLFPYKVNIKPPVDNSKLVSWKSQLEEDKKAIQAQDNRNRLTEASADH